MRFSDFKKHIRSYQFIATGKVLIELNDLKMYHPENDKRINLVKDERTYKENDTWNIKPIATTRKQVFIVCPYCGEIHIHGNEDNNYRGARSPHCKKHHGKSDYNIIQL